MIDAIVWGAGTVPLFMLAAGLRRIPWRYAAVVGLGAGIVFTTLRLVTNVGLEAEVGVLLGATGGSLAQLGFDIGERERKRRAAAFLAGTESPAG